MEPDPLIAPSAGISKQKTNDKFKGCKKASGLNVVVCVLCIVCATACVYNALREAILEDRLTYLEDKVASLEEKTMRNLDVIIERFRREAESRFKQRVTREVASEHLIMGLKRAPRDAPECICPAGKSTFSLVPFLHFICLPCSGTKPKQTLYKFKVNMQLPDSCFIVASSSLYLSAATFNPYRLTAGEVILFTYVLISTFFLALIQPLAVICNTPIAVIA